MATMGRLMKNFDMGLTLPPASLAVLSGTNGLGFTCMPGRTFCTPSATTRSPRFRPSVIIHSAADAVADCHRADADFVFVVDDGDLIAALQFGDGALRNE